MSPIISHNDDGTSLLSFITTGGELDISFFFNGTAKEIISRYHNFIGKPAMPPFWARTIACIDLRSFVVLIPLAPC